MTETIFRLLLRLSEDGDALLSGADAEPHYGPEFSRLLHSGVLREEAPLSDWAVCPDCECGAPWRPLEADNGQFRARCPLDRSRDVIVEAEALRVFRVDGQAFADFMARAAGLGEEAERITPGLWSLGVLPSRRQVAVCFDRHVVEDAQLPLILGALTCQRATLLGPPATPETQLALRAAGIEWMEAASVWTTDSSGRTKMDLLLIDPTGPVRLVLDVPAQRVILDGTLQHVPRQPLVFLELLIAAALGEPGRVPNFDIQERSSGRPAKDLARDLRNALSMGRPNKDEIKTWIAADRSAGAFWITLPPEEMEMRR